MGRKKQQRGFAIMDKAQVIRIASMGGKASHGGGRPPKIRCSYCSELTARKRCPHCRRIRPEII